MILFLICLIGCKKPLKADNAGKEKLTVEPTPLANDSATFKYMQDLFLNEEHEKFVSEFVNFPIEGDCIFYFCYGEDVFENGFSYYEDKLDASVFLKNFHNIFDTAAVDLIKNVDFPRILKDKDYVLEKEYENGKANISFIYHNDEYDLFVSYKDPVESIADHSVAYAFKKIDGKLKLYKIYSIG